MKFSWKHGLPETVKSFLKSVGLLKKKKVVSEIAA